MIVFPRYHMLSVFEAQAARLKHGFQDLNTVPVCCLCIAVMQQHVGVSLQAHMS